MTTTQPEEPIFGVVAHNSVPTFTPGAGFTTVGTVSGTRVIVVLRERFAKVNSYAILAVRPATPGEIKLWLEGTQ